jgi:hypothetical protein
MAETQIWRAPRIRPAGGRASAASGPHGRGRRAGRRLWAVLNAQALITGTAGAPYDVAYIEDDSRRMRRS